MNTTAKTPAVKEAEKDLREAKRMAPGYARAEDGARMIRLFERQLAKAQRAAAKGARS